MAVEITGHFEGLDGVLNQLDGVEKRVRKKALRKVVASGSSKLAAAAKARIPKREPRSIPKNWHYAGNQLKRSIGRKVKAYGDKQVGIIGARLGYRIQVGVTTRKGRKRQAGEPIFVNPVKYLHLLLLGTSHSRGVNFLDQAKRAMAGEIETDAAAIVEDAVRGA